jgi:hypothetical protein
LNRDFFLFRNILCVFRDIDFQDSLFEIGCYLGFINIIAKRDYSLKGAIGSFEIMIISLFIFGFIFFHTGNSKRIIGARNLYVLFVMPGSSTLIVYSFSFSEISRVGEKEELIPALGYPKFQKRNRILGSFLSEGLKMDQNT